MLLAVLDHGDLGLAVYARARHGLREGSGGGVTGGGRSALLRFFACPSTIVDNRAADVAGTRLAVGVRFPDSGEAGGEVELKMAMLRKGISPLDPVESVATFKWSRCQLLCASSSARSSLVEQVELNAIACCDMSSMYEDGVARA